MKKTEPPRWADRILSWYCDPSLLPEIQGDLHELYQRWTKHYGTKKAQWFYLANVVTFMRPFAYRRSKNDVHYTINHIAMFRNYLIIALRNLQKQKFYSSVNVLGLTIGMSCCLLILLYVSHELSYDRFNTKADRIYRVVTDIKTNTETINSATCAGPVGPYLTKEFPEVLTSVRMNIGSYFMQKGEDKYREDQVLEADSTLFKVFDYKLLQGNPQTALIAPFSLVLTQNAAKKYFGKENPVGQSMRLNNKYDVMVTGVMENVPNNSQFQFDMVLSLSTVTQKLATYTDESWGSFGYYTFVLLPEQHDDKALESKLQAFIDQHTVREAREVNMHYSLFLEPLIDIYLHSDRLAPTYGNIYNIYIFSITAVFILVLACVNFMNLTIARSVERSLEVGVRKVIGASRMQLTLQFLGESLIFSLISCLLAIASGEALLPFFNQVAGKTITDSLIKNPEVWMAFCLMIPLVVLLAGIYPAIVLSGFKPIMVLKGKFWGNRKGVALRRSLVVFQFAVSIALIIGTMVVYKQLSFLRSHPLGFHKDQVMILPVLGDQAIGKKCELIKSRISQIPGVSAVSASTGVPSLGQDGAYTEIENPNGELQPSNMGLYSIDFSFLDQYQIGIVAGRKFSQNFSTDSTDALMVNETAVKSLGYASPEDIIGKRFSQWGRKGQVIGVFKNFHTTSLQKEIKPLTMRIRTHPADLQFFSINVHTGQLSATIENIKQTWVDLVPYRPFDFIFLDEAFNQQYQGEERFGKLFLYFSGVAIFIACLGLLALTFYITVHRTKEIGIRKILGASMQTIIFLLSKDYLQLIAVAFVIAVPLAWYLMYQWLQNFAYQTHLSFWVFIASGILTMVIALTTICWQSMKAALANPVDSLRNE
jgi:putative ABC transport system permease protein